jgi:hypothetical protein
MLAFQIIIFCLLAVGIIALLIKNLSKCALVLQTFYDRNMKKVFGGSIGTPSLTICKIHVVFIVIVLLAIVFNLCFGTIHLGSPYPGQ